MTPTEYEHLVASILRAEGWKATVTPPAGDHGLDVIAERSSERLGVQVKMYGNARPINAETVMLTYGAAACEGCTRRMIATDARVLPDAVVAAQKLDVEIRSIPATWPPTGLEGGARQDRADVLSFGVIWSKQVAALVGRELHRADGTSNMILAVDAGGLVRRTSNGRKQHIGVEIFRWTIERLLLGETVLHRTSMPTTSAEPRLAWCSFCRRCHSSRRSALAEGRR
ncbi:MAG: restriction endonuclease [Acidimicrobiales bacterium]